MPALEADDRRLKLGYSATIRVRIHKADIGVARHSIQTANTPHLSAAFCITGRRVTTNFQDKRKPELARSSNKMTDVNLVHVPHRG
jgi:hypothetical protein